LEPQPAIVAHVQTDFKRVKVAVGNDWFGKQLLPSAMETQFFPKISEALLEYQCSNLRDRIRGGLQSISILKFLHHV
jgi:hypothetical protein